MPTHMSPSQLVVFFVNYALRFSKFLLCAQFLLRFTVLFFVSYKCALVWPIAAKSTYYSMFKAYCFLFRPISRSVVSYSDMARETLSVIQLLLYLIWSFLLLLAVSIFSILCLFLLVFTRHLEKLECLVALNWLWPNHSALNLCCLLSPYETHNLHFVLCVTTLHNYFISAADVFYACLSVTVQYQILRVKFMLHIVCTAIDDIHISKIAFPGYRAKVSSIKKNYFQTLRSWL